MAETILKINHLSKSFGNHEVLRDIDFTVEKGDVTSIIGASGSGKSTLLRCINLLEIPTSGEILYHGLSVAEKADIRLHDLEIIRNPYVMLGIIVLCVFVMIAFKKMPRSNGSAKYVKSVS